jgi:hypothetical protein
VRADGYRRIVQQLIKHQARARREQAKKQQQPQSGGDVDVPLIDEVRGNAAWLGSFVVVVVLVVTLSDC